MPELKFNVRSPANRSEVVDVQYKCECGCKPMARYERGSPQSGSQHCCCGIVHFAGADADAQMQKYLDKRKADGRDAPDARYDVRSATVKAPWGEQLKVAYALPASAV